MPFASRTVAAVRLRRTGHSPRVRDQRSGESPQRGT